MADKKLLSLLVPMHNEEACMDVFFETVIGHLQALESRGVTWEIIVVDDGSRDSTAQKIMQWAEREPRIRGLILSRNFGKEAALTAALDMAEGDAVIPIDADLQDPPELMADMVDKWQAGAQMVVGVRCDRAADSWTKRNTSLMFYKVFNALADRGIPENAGDFRLMDKCIVEVLRRFPERNRFMKGLFAWVGFRTAYIHYTRPARAGGDTKWGYGKLFNFALDGITSFSTLPLRIWLYTGFAIASGALLAIVYYVVKTLLLGDPAPGFPTIMVTLLFLGGLQMLALGMVGEYVGKIYHETKQRPLYVVNHKVNGTGEA